MREFSKKFTKPNEMDMKKIPKPRMEESDRHLLREREKNKRQQAQTGAVSELTLFPEPRRVKPSEGDDDITAKLGDHSKAIEYMNTAFGIYANVIQCPPNNAAVVGMPPSASSSSSSAVSSGYGSSGQRLPPPHQPPPSSSSSHHYPPPASSRQPPYVKQPDNKLPYNGRGGGGGVGGVYPGQPVKNDIRSSSSSMAPPKGLPPLFSASMSSSSSSASSSSALLPPPASVSSLPNGHLGPPASTVAQHNGRFSKPNIPNKPASRGVDSALESILKKVNLTYRAPGEITKIAATPHTTIGEFNLNGPNRNKYSFDPVGPIASSPPATGAELLAPLDPAPPVSSMSTSTSVSGPPLVAAITPLGDPPAVSSMLLSVSAAVPVPMPAVANMAATQLPKEPIKPLTTTTIADKVAPPVQEKQNSTLLNDLELSESDDDRRKVSRSMHNSSDSSQSDSSESGSEESSKSEHQQSTQPQLPQQQQQLPPQQTAHVQQPPLLQPTHHNTHHASIAGPPAPQQAALTSTSRSTATAVPGRSYNTKLKGNDNNRASVYLSSNTLGSAGSTSSGQSSTSSCNKTPSPSDSNKWQLAFYFNKAAMLPGGAQIIPEPTPQQLAAAGQPNTAIVKNEKNLSLQSDDEDDEDCDESGVSGAPSADDQFHHHHHALIGDIKKEADVLLKSSSGSVGVAPNSHSQGAGSQPQQVPMLNASEFVAIPTSQIKPEPYTSKRSPIVSPRPRTDSLVNSESLKNSDEFRHVERLSSDSNSSDADDEPTNVTTVPTLGPGGTLKIPGVPAAITALPPSPPQPMASALAPTLPNSITVLPIEPQRRRQHKKQKLSRQHVDTSDEEDGMTVPGSYKTGPGLTVSPAALKMVTAPGGKLYADPSAATATKKGPGRPRKQQGGSAVAASSNIATIKGPTLTAKKEVSTTVTGPKKATARRRVSRQNSTTAVGTPTKMVTQQPALLSQQLQQLHAVGTRVTRETSVDSSSSSSSSCSTSKSSSSSSSESEAASGDGGGAGSNSSSEEDDVETVAKQSQERLMAAHTGLAATNRRIVQLNKRISSQDDGVLAQPKVIPELIADEDEDDDDDSSSDSSSDESAVVLPDAAVPVVAPVRAVAAVSKPAAAANSGVSSAERIQAMFPPTSTSCSSDSSSSSSSSSEGDHSNAELKSRGKASAGAVPAAKRRRRDKPKASDKNKKDTLTRIFNPKEGGAKKQGQVLVIDQSGEQSDHAHQPSQQQQQQQSQSQQPSMSVNMIRKLTGSQENLSAATGAASVTQSSPRRTPGHLRSPRPLPVQLLAGAHRTPDRSSSSAERKLQQRIKTPTRTPTRTPPTTRTPTPTPAAAMPQLPPVVGASTTTKTNPTNAVSSAPPSLICKISLSRLARIPPEWHTNSFRLYGTSGNSSSGAGTPRSTGSRTPTPQAVAERERERERGKQRLSYTHSNGRMSSRSAEGGSTPKDLAPPSNLTPNGYTTAPPRSGMTAHRAGSTSPKPTKPIAGLKHENIKNEPDLDGSTAAAMALASNVYCSDTKFKTAGGTAAAVKQELLLKHDYKPIGDLNYGTSEKQLDASPVLAGVGAEAKPRRKRSSSSSSSPYKEKKRKKEKHGKESGAMAETASASPLGNALAKDKESKLANEGTNNSGAATAVPGHKGMMGASSNNGQVEKEITPHENHQLPPTNHDRLLGDSKSQDMLQHPQATTHPQQLPQQQQQQQQQHLESSQAQLNAHHNAAMTAHLHPTGNKPTAGMPPPVGGEAPATGVGALSRVAAHFNPNDDVPNSTFRNNVQFLQQAVARKHAADRETNPFTQVIIYLEAVVYFLLYGASLEYTRGSEDASWTMYKDTLALIKYISTKFKNIPPPSSPNSAASSLQEPHNKVAVLSLRCQSLISLKLYKMKRIQCRNLITVCSEYFRKNSPETNIPIIPVNGNVGNTPTLNSPSNSVCSQGSGSNTPPSRLLRPDKILKHEMFSALNQENQYFNYLASCHELWDQADKLVKMGNHTNFFIELDQEMGPLTLHSSIHEVFCYVQAGLEKLKKITATNDHHSNPNSTATSAAATAPKATSNNTSSNSNSRTSTNNISNVPTH